MPVTEAFEHLNFEARMASKAIQNGQKPKNIFKTPAYEAVKENMDNIMSQGQN